MKIFRQSLLTAAISAVLIGVPAQAQDSDADVLEEIIVTGSRIRQDPLESRAPVQVLSKRDIERSGHASLADFVQRLPIAGSAIRCGIWRVATKSCRRRAVGGGSFATHGSHGMGSMRCASIEARASWTLWTFSSWLKPSWSLWTWTPAFSIGR